MNGIRVLLVGVVGLLSCVAVFGAKQEPLPFPGSVESVKLQMVSGILKKGWEIPAGAYTDEETRTIFTGHQKGMNVSLLFGPFGVLAANQANKAGGKERSEELKLFGATSVESILETRLKSEFEVNATGFVSPNAAGHSLNVCPYIILNRNQKTGTKIFAMSVVELREEGQAKPVWRTRFYSELPEVFNDEQLKDEALLAASLEGAVGRLARAIRMAVRMDFGLYEPKRYKARLAGLPSSQLPSVAVLEDIDGAFAMLRTVQGFFPGYVVLHSDSIEYEPVKKFKDKHREAFEGALGK